MSIPEVRDNIKPETVHYEEEGHIEEASVLKRYFLAFLFILVAILSFGIGKLSATRSSGGVKINYDATYAGSALTGSGDNSAAVIKSTITAPNDQNTAEINSGVYASSKGKRYYYSWCKSTIVEKNKITFATKEMAESAGYTLASGCKPK